MEYMIMNWIIQIYEITQEKYYKNTKYELGTRFEVADKNDKLTIPDRMTHS